MAGPDTFGRNQLAVTDQKRPQVALRQLGPRQKGPQGGQVRQGPADIGRIAGQYLVQQRHGAFMGNIHFQVDLLGVGALIATVAIGSQLALDIGALEVDRGQVPVQDGQVQVIHLDRTTDDAAPQLTQLGRQVVERPAEPVVVGRATRTPSTSGKTVPANQS